MPYRRCREFRYWHWFTNCPHWPSHDFDSAPLTPTEGEMCLHCHRLENDGSGEGSIAIKPPDDYRQTDGSHLSNTKKDYSALLTIPENGPMTLIVDGDDFDGVNAFLEVNDIWLTVSKQDDGTVFLIFDPGQDVSAIKELLEELTR